MCAAWCTSPQIGAIQKKFFAAKAAKNAFSSYFSYFLQLWLATVQLVLQADWQEAWHSPQPPVLALWARQGFWIV